MIANLNKRDIVAAAIVFAFAKVTMACIACPCAFDPTGAYTREAAAALQQKDYATARAMLEHAMKLDKHNANVIYNLALVYLDTGNYAEAEKYMLQSIEVLSSTYGAAHRQVAQGYMDLGDLYENESYDTNLPELKKKTTDCYLKSVALCERIYADVSGESSNKGSTSRHRHSSAMVCQIEPKQAALDLSVALRRTADIYATDDNYKEAEPLYKRSLYLEQLVNGADDSEVCKHKTNLAEFYCEESKQPLAEPLFKEALATSEKIYGADSDSTAQILYKYANMFRDENRMPDAETMLSRAVDILSKIKGKDEKDLAEKSTALADVLDKLGKSNEAERVCSDLLARLDNNENKDALMLALQQYHKHLLLQHNRVEAEKVADRIKDLKAQLSKKAQ